MLPSSQEWLQERRRTTAIKDAILCDDDSSARAITQYKPVEMMTSGQGKWELKPKWRTQQVCTK